MGKLPASPPSCEKLCVSMVRLLLGVLSPARPACFFYAAHGAGTVKAEHDAERKAGIFIWQVPYASGRPVQLPCGPPRCASLYARTLLAATALREPRIISVIQPSRVSLYWRWSLFWLKPWSASATRRRVIERARGKAAA